MGSRLVFFLLLVFLCIAILAAVSAAEPPPEPLKVFEHRGSVFVCWDKETGTAASVEFESSLDLAREFLTLRQWGVLSGKVQINDWSACSDALCYSEDEQVIEDACGKQGSGWVVAENKWPFVETLPIYACGPACLADQEQGKQIGRTGIELVAECDGPLDPPWPSPGGLEWQFTLADSGIKGLARCAPKENAGTP